jgi:hypothetical protein
MRELKQYYFNRDDFTKTFIDVFGDRSEDVIVACQEGKSTYSFLLHYDEGEYYIIHLESGTIINWYKHIGRTNTCNDDTFTLTDLRDFLTLLKDELYGERSFK